MSEFSRLKATLKRGALIAAANWQVVVVQFVGESTFKLLLAVPLVGGASLVALLIGSEVDHLLAADFRQVVLGLASALADHPVALVSFLFAFLIVSLGGSSLMFFVKAGTVGVLAEAEKAAGAIERPPLRLATFRRASKFSIDAFLNACAHFSRRYVRLGLWLLVVYAVSGGLYLAVVLTALNIVGDSGVLFGWTALAALASSALIVWITLVNLLYLLVQIAVTVGDCGVRDAIRDVSRFLHQRFRDVATIFLVVLALVVAATTASLLATAGLGLISFVPFVGLAVFPLQAAAWLLRGLIFQYLGLATLSAYLTIYREFVESRRENPASDAQLRTAS